MQCVPTFLVAQTRPHSSDPHAYNRCMNKTQMTETLQDLQDYMFDTMASSEMALDWYCDRFETNATDEVIDFVLDAHEAFFGEADQSYLNSVMLDD